MEIIARKRKPVVIQSHRQKLSPSERSSLMDKKADLQSQLSAPEAGHLLQSRPVLEKNLADISQRLNDDEGLVAKGKMKDFLVKQRRGLEEILRKTIDPITQRWVKPGDPEYEKAVQAAMAASDPKVSQLADQYREVSTRLEPDDPDAGSISRVLTA